MSPLCSAHLVRWALIAIYSRLTFKDFCIVTALDERDNVYFQSKASAFLLPFIKDSVSHLDGCGSVGWVSPGRVKGCPSDSQGTHLGCRFGPQSGRYERQLVDVSLLHGCFSPLSPSLPVSLKIHT